MNIEPCMFCKTKSHVELHGNYPNKYIACHYCGATGPIEMDIEEATEAWNEVARIVREARDPKFITPSFSIQEMFIYRGMRYEIIWKKTESEDSYFVKINDYLYDKEHETFTDAYAWMLNEVDILVAAKEKDNA